MPVKGLMPGLMEVGKIKIGIKGDKTTSTGGAEFRLPKKIDHFRIVKNERDEEDNYLLDEEILKIIKKNKNAVYKGRNKDLIGIPIRLLYNEIDLVFPTQYASYVNAKLSCSGDGIKGHTRDNREVTCPCNRLDNKYTGKDKCKINGVLSCIIEGSNVGGCYKFRTTSINSARYILSSLMLIKAATGGLLAFIPLRLVINPKKTLIPSTGQHTTIYVVTVEFQGGIEELQQKALEMGKERVSLIENMRDIETEAKRIVSPDTVQEERDIAEEFFPENIETEKGATQEDEEIKPSETDSQEAESEETETSPDETKPENEPEVEDESKIDPPEKIRKSQLVEILALKKTNLQINDQKAWHELIKSMKFPDVEKANDMTAEQGDKFIEYLKSLQDIPF